MASVRLETVRGWIPDLSARERGLLALLGWAAFFGMYDRQLLSLLLVQIQADLSIPDSQVAFLGAAVRLGAFPAFLFLLASDRVGRRRLLLVTILGYAVATGLTALAPGFNSLAASQIAARTFMTAEGLLATVFVIEELEARHRGFGVGVLGMFGALGSGTAMIGFGFVESIPGGWRGLYAFGIGPLLLLAWLRRGLGETQRFEGFRDTLESHRGARGWLAPVAGLLRSHPGRFAAVATVGFLWNFSNAPVDFLLPKFVQEVHGWSPATYAKVSILAGGLGVLGFLAAGWASDRVGRRAMGVLFTLVEPLAAAALFTVAGAWIAPLIFVWIFSSVSNDVIQGAFRAELFPTSHRSTAAGAVIMVATLGGAAGLALEGLLYAGFGSHWTPVRLLALSGLAIPLVVALSFPETSGRVLEEISPE